MSATTLFSWHPAQRFAQLMMADGPATDGELVRLAKAGDTEAWGALFRAYQGRIYALCLRMTASPALAEDFTQDAFVRAWNKLGSFRGDSSLLTWLHRVAVNVVLGGLRSRGRWEKREVSAEPLERAGGASDPAAAIDLERAIASLPGQARAVFVLHDVEGYRHREVGELLGLAEGTSKAHLHRARRLLRKALDK